MAFLKGFNIGSLESFKGIAEGVENSNYFLQTDKDRYILTLYEKRVQVDDLPYYLAFMTHLASRGLPAPSPIADKSGNTLFTLAKKPAAVIEFLSGVSVDQPDPDHCYSGGEALAKMHMAMADFTLSRPNSLSLTGWQELARKTTDRADAVEPGLASMISKTLHHLTKAWPSGLPSGPIHADLFPDNVLFKGTRVTGLIDFYFACTDMLAYDLSIMLNAWCFSEDHGYIPAAGAALLEGYAKHRPLTEQEWQALPTLAQGSAIRFLLTRLYDWLNPVEGAVVRPKDPRDYLTRLAFHQSCSHGHEYKGSGH